MSKAEGYRFLSAVVPHPKRAKLTSGILDRSPLFWSVIFVRYFPRRDIKTALALAGALWLAILVVFFPIVGWGLAGLNVSPKLIPASFVPHLLFGLLLWLLDKYLPALVLRNSHPA